MPTQTLSKQSAAKISLSPTATKRTLEKLKKANAAFAKAYSGESGERQAVHTVYGGAHLFKSDTAQKLGSLALKSIEEYAPDPLTFAKATGLYGSDNSDNKTEKKDRFPLARTIYNRVIEKLKREPVEDFRIDFEDGYGNRPDAEEDRHAELAAAEAAKGMSEGTLPPFIGIRIKPMSQEMHARSIRTLDIFVTSLAGRTRGKLPPHFVITIPKVVIPEHVSAVAELCGIIESKTKLPKGSLRLELMIETPQSIFGRGGQAVLRELVDAAHGRCGSAHFGTYDYTALCNITAAHQHMMHHACDFAKDVMQVSLAQTGVLLSDGATNIMPAPIHRPIIGGPELTAEQIRENQLAVHRAWKLHFDHIQHSLVNAYYQGWDLHPAQLPTRYAAVYAFFLEGLPAASVRLKNFIEKAAQATLIGDVFDDAATGQGLLNYFLRGLNCGAITMDEALQTGLTLEELQGRSFLKILQNRRKIEAIQMPKPR